MENILFLLGPNACRDRVGLLRQLSHPLRASYMTRDFRHGNRKAGLMLQASLLLLQLPILVRGTHFQVVKVLVDTITSLPMCHFATILNVCFSIYESSSGCSSNRWRMASW